MEYGELGNLLSGAASALGVVATLFAIRVSSNVHKASHVYQQRQQILPIWQYLSSLSEIDPRSPITSDVVRAVNTLELVALSCESEIVDPRVIKRTFREAYRRFYKAIEAIESLPGLDKSGKQLLAENRAACSFYDELEAEEKRRDLVPPLKK